MYYRRLTAIAELLAKKWEPLKEHIAEITGNSTIFSRCKMIMLATGGVEGFKAVEKGLAGGKKCIGNNLFIKICTETPSEQLQYEEYAHAAKVV